MNRSLIWKGVGLLFAVVGLYFMVQSVQFYVECCRQVDWPVEIATVVAVEQRRERSGIRSGSKTVYDVDYRYTVDGTVYAGEIYGTVDSTKRVGTTFPVKYDPAAPEHSNHVLSPSVPNLIVGVGGALFFILFALVATGVVRLNRRKSSYEDTEDFLCVISGCAASVVFYSRSLMPS